MRYIYFALSALVTFLLVRTLDNPLSVKGQTLPALGIFFSPFDGFWHNAESVKTIKSDLQLSGVSKPVKVVYDDRDIPHIFAENITDALFAQGYIHAQNRLWEMDFLSHVSAGRLSEILGDQKIGKSSTVEVDKRMRRMGVSHAAERLVEYWQKDKANFELFNAYCNGANAYIGSLQTKDYPVEYKILGVKPELFSPLKIALVSKYLSLDLARTDNDFAATNAKTLLGSDFDAIFPEYFKDQAPVVPSGTPFNFKTVETLHATSNTMSNNTTSNTLSNNTTSNNKTSSNKTNETLHATSLQQYITPKELNAYDQFSPDENNGSNNWAVAASKTKNKKPILCGDPHLSLRLPSVWFEQQIITPDMNTYGVTLPGIPMVLIGFNNNCAWTMTNVGHDVADWYKIAWTDAQKTQYTLDGATKTAQLVQEKIYIKGQAQPLIDTVRYTFWGPVVYFGDTTNNNDLAYKWLANEKPEIDLTFLAGLNKSKNYDDYRKALANMNVPAQNIAFACNNGDIALIANGSMPIKRKEQGRFVQDGSLSSNNWQGFVPRDQIPQYKNPARGFVSSANQHSTDPSYPYYYNSEGFEPFRGRIINDTLSKMKDITIDDMKGLQNDNFSLLAKESLPAMFKNLDETQLNATEKGILAQLKNWNYYFDGDKIEPAYFMSWFEAVHTATWDEILKSKNADYTLNPTQWRTANMLREEPNNKYFDIVATTNKIENARDIVTSAFHDMMTDMAKKTSDVATAYPNAPAVNWSKVKDTEIPHIANIPGFGRKHIDVGGQAKSVNAIKKNHGPSWRMIVELDSVPHAWVVYPGGQSGNPGSKNFDAFVDTWTKGQYYEAIFMRNPTEVNKRIVSTQTISKL